MFRLIDLIICIRKTKKLKLFLFFIIIFIAMIYFHHPFNGFINRYMTISINSNFKKTILGDIVFKFNENESIAFFEDEKDFSKGMNKRIPVNDIVDVKTFRRVKSEYNITIYEDSLHIYELHNGDDVFMLFLEKNKK